MITPTPSNNGERHWLMNLALSSRRSGFADRVFIRDDDGNLISALDWRFGVHLFTSKRFQRLNMHSEVHMGFTALHAKSRKSRIGVL